jgi:hypothetical protein
MESKFDKNYQYYVDVNLGDYSGEWVAICNSKVVSHGKNLKKVYEEASKLCPGERPLLTKVPTKETMIF